MNIEGLEIVVSNGKAKLTARSEQQSNPSMYRPGSGMYELASNRQAKANRILHDLNTTGSYINSAGMKTTINRGSNLLKYGQWSQSAVQGTDAWETQQRIASAGGLNALQAGSVSDGSMGVGAMIDFVIDEASAIGDDIMGKANAYLNTVAATTANIAQSIIDISTD